MKPPWRLRTGRSRATRTLLLGVVSLLLIASGLSVTLEYFPGAALYASPGSPQTGIAWEGSPSVRAFPLFVSCAASSTATRLTASVTNVAPGSQCLVNATIVNVGRLSVALQETRSVSVDGNCRGFVFSDDLFGYSTAPVLRAGGTFDYTLTVGLAPSAGNACQGAVAVLDLSILAQRTCGDDFPDCD